MVQSFQHRDEKISNLKVEVAMGVEENEIDMRVAVGSVDEAVDARQALSVRSAELAAQ